MYKQPAPVLYTYTVDRSYISCFDPFLFVRLLSILLTGLLMLFTPAMAQKRIRVSDNNRYLVKEDGTPFFYLGDTAWELFHRATREEAEQYLENRRQKGFTVIQAVALAEMKGVTTPNAYGDIPLFNNNPATPKVTPGTNHADTAAYDYWDHVDWIIQKAADKGLYIGLLPSWGEWVTPWQGTIAYFHDAAQGYAYGYFLGKRYKDQPNIIWILGGDRLPDTRKEGLEIWRAIAEGIADGTNDQPGCDGKADYSTTLMTYHCKLSSSRWFHQDEWIDFHMWGSYHGKYNNPESYTFTEADWKRENPKPTLNGEPAYEDHPVNYKGDGSEGYFDETDVRQAAYWSLFSGAFGHTYGAHPIWQFYKKGKQTISPYTRHYWDEVLDLPGAFQMTHVRYLMESRPMLSRIPDQSLLAEDAGTGADHIRATRGDGYAFIYIPTGRPVKIQMGRISGIQVVAWWFNPRTGEAQRIAKVANQGIQEFKPTGEIAKGNDWVLVLDDAGKRFGQPGKKDR